MMNRQLRLNLRIKLTELHVRKDVKVIRQVNLFWYGWSRSHRCGRGRICGNYYWVSDFNFYVKEWRKYVIRKAMPWIWRRALICRYVYDLVISPMQHLLAISFGIYSAICWSHIQWSNKIKSFYFSLYSNISFIDFESPKRFSVLIFLTSMIFNSSLDSSYFMYNRKHFTFSILWSQSHDEFSMLLCRFR